MSSAIASQVRKNYPVLIPYQVDFHTDTTGKHISATKRHARWRFGFVHIPSALQGKSGVECRGMELDLHVIWSVTSGKFMIYLNSFPVHQSSPTPQGRSPKLEHSLTLPEDVFPGRHLVHILAWAIPSAAPKGHPQFTMTLDGQNFDSFFKIFQLGPSILRHYQPVKGNLSEVGGLNGNVAAAAAADRQIPNDENSDVDTIVRGRPRYNSQKSARTVQTNHISHLPLAPPPTVEFPTLRQSHSSPLFSPGRGGGGGGVNANYTSPRVTDEERRQIAQAKVHSFRDLRGEIPDRVQRHHSENMPHNRHGGGGRHGSDNISLDSGLSYSDSSMPAFARPSPDRKQQSPFRKPPTPPVHNPLPPKPTSYPINNDFLDLNPPPAANIGGGRRPILRTTSSLTLDTMLKSTTEDKRDDMSYVADTPHLDPTQIWKTQQGLSFRLQNPPVYADTMAGDLINPSPSFQQPVAPNTQHVLDPTRNKQRHSFDPIGINQSFITPEAPTWDSLNAAFVPQQQQSHQQQRYY